MQIKLEIDTAQDGSREAGLLSAIAALLGGTSAAAITAPTPEPHPLATSDKLIEQEARRAAGEPTGDSNTGTVSPPVDSSGLPWDARIHGQSAYGSYPTNANGTWRKKRNVDEALVAQVEAELRGAPADTAVPPPPATPTDVPLPPVEPSSETPPPPPVATAPVTSAATSAGSATGRFANFAEITKALNEIPGTVYDKLNAHAASFGLSKWIDARNQPEIWDEFYETYAATNGA